MPSDNLPKAGDKPGTILVVDDEPEILVALEDLFEDDYQVLATSSASQALDLLAREPDIAVIISDQRMPEMPGDVFLAHARSVTDAEAILLTGYADLKAVISALNNGRIVAYAPKPWEPEVLRSIVASAYQRHRLARELRIERALLHGLMESTGDAVSFKDSTGRFVRLNSRKADELQQSVEACLGRPEAAFVDAETAARIETAERAVIETRQAAATIDKREGEDGTTRWCAIDRLPIRGDDEAVDYLVTIERDITEQRQIEERLRQSEKMQSLGTLAGGISHDFNNLLTAVIGSLDLALRSRDDPERLNRLLRNALQAAERGKALTQRLLSFSRQQEFAVRAVNVNQLIDGMGDLLSRTLGGIVRVEKRLAPDLWLAQADVDQLELAILNLCINARDAMPEGGMVTLSTENCAVTDASGELPGGDYVVVCVADTGTGMTPEVLARAFEPFFTTKEVGKGTGLGLSMVYGMVRQLGGEVRISSKPGEGTAISLYLPRSSERPADEKPQAAARTMVRPMHILLVDDDPDVRAVSAAYLEELGHSYVTCGSGFEGLDIASRDGNIDLVIVDFAMPGMTGLEMASALRQHRPELPVLLVTGYAELADCPDGVTILRKPFRQDELGETLAQLSSGRD